MYNKEEACRLCGAPQAELFAVRTSGERYFRCDNCALVYLEPDWWLGAEAEKDRYLLHNNEEGDQGYLNFLKRLAEPLLEKLSSGARGLDFGAGPGPVLATYLTSRGCEMSLYDPFFHPDQQALETSYDFVTCTEAAEHFFIPRKEFDQLFKLLKPGGPLGLMTEFVFKDIAPKDFLNWYYARDPSHVCFYETKTLEWIGKHYGADLEIPRKNVAIFTKRL